MLEPSPALVRRGRPTGLATPVLFFALQVEDEAARAQIATLVREVRAQYRLRGRAIPPERLHLPLMGLGPDDDQTIARAMKVAAAAAREMRPFALSFTSLMTLDTRGADKPLVLCGEKGAGVRLLHAALAGEMRRAGLGALAKAGLTPQVTVLRDALVVPETPIAPVGWQAAGFELVRSPAGQVRHEVLGRWLL